MHRDLGIENHTLEGDSHAPATQRLRQPEIEKRVPRPPTFSTPPQKGHLLRKVVIWTVIVAILAAIGVRMVQNHEAAAQKDAATAKAGAGGFPVPVIAGSVQQKDVPIYLDGLGTIQALNTVTVHTRVDGQIVKIAFTEGQDVKKGDMLVQIDPAPYKAALEQAQAKQKTDEANLNNDQVNLKRDQEMITRKVISQQEYDTQVALVAQMVATVQNDAAAVAAAQVNLDYTSITAPFDGRTGIRLIDEGNLVHAADTNGIVVLTELHPISLIFTLPEQTLAQIHKQQEETPDLKVLAVDRDNKTLFDEGKLTVIDNQIDITTGTIKLKAEFPNEHLQLWPGQFVNARLLLNIRKNGVVVPATVVQRGPDNAYAYMIVDDPQKGPVAEMRTLKVAQIEQGEALIDEGLKPGERVVVDGQYKLQPGSKVKIGDAPARAGGANPSGHDGLQKAGASGKAGAKPKAEGAAQ